MINFGRVLGAQTIMEVEYSLPGGGPYYHITSPCFWDEGSTTGSTGSTPALPLFRSAARQAAPCSLTGPPSYPRCGPPSSWSGSSEHRAPERRRADGTAGLEV